MPDQVVSIARCKCNAGDAEPALFATTSPRVILEGERVATIADLTFMGTFGTCGRRDHRPCAYAPAATWTILPANALFGGLPPLIQGARLRCVEGGEITILDVNQLTTDTGVPVTSEGVMAAGFALPPWLPGWLRDQGVDSLTYRPLCNHDINEHNPVCKQPDGSDPPDEIFERRGPPGPPPVPVRLTPYHSPSPAPAGESDGTGIRDRIWSAVEGATKAVEGAAEVIDEGVQNFADNLPTNDPDAPGPFPPFLFPGPAR